MAASTVRNSPPPGSEPWQVIGHSVLGASHSRSGKENQDHLKWKDDRGRVILAVADGHGSAKSFRSAKGSEFAVDVSFEFAEDLLRAASGRDDRVLSLVRDRLATDIPRRIVHGWTKRVDDHLARNRFTEQELVALEEQDSPKSRRLVEQDGRLAYGSTLVTAIALESFVVLWQIGDGDVLTVSADRDVSRPVRTDARLMANETTSLCSADAARMFRCEILVTPVPMIMLSTDGFSNSFLDDEGFFKFGSDVGDIIVEQGLAKVAADLPDWLTEITQQGSGDDISLGIICRPRALTPKTPRPPVKEPDRFPPEAPTVIATSYVPAGRPPSPVLPAGGAPPARLEPSHAPTIVVPQGELPTAVDAPPRPLVPGQPVLARNLPPAETPEPPKPRETSAKKKWYRPWAKGEKGQDDSGGDQPDDPPAEPAVREDARDRRNK